MSDTKNPPEDTEGVKALSSKAENVRISNPKNTRISNPKMEAIFDSGYEAGQDKVMVRQFDNVRCSYKRYRERVITAASSDSEQSDTSKNASGGGSQDSIDSILKAFDHFDHQCPKLWQAKEAIEAWHNTQLKAVLQSLREKAVDYYVIDEGGYEASSDPVTAVPVEAIDDMQANLQRSGDGR